MKRKLYTLFLAAFLLLGLPLTVCASVHTESYGDSPELYYIELNKEEISFARPGLSEKLYVADFADADYPYSGVTWKSDDPSVATVLDDGEVRAVGCGECTVTATSRDAAGVSAECQVTVEKYAVTYHYKYVTRTGDKYHRGSCRYLRQSKIAISKAEAKKQGYTPCKVCRP